MSINICNTNLHFNISYSESVEIKNKYFKLHLVLTIAYLKLLLNYILQRFIRRLKCFLVCLIKYCIYIKYYFQMGGIILPIIYVYM